jgi:anti-anti-sigma factor
MTSTRTQTSVEKGVTIVAVGREFQNIDEEALETLRPLLETIVREANPPRVVIDLRETRFFGSSFIGVLVRLLRTVQSQPNSAFGLCGLSPYCREVLSVTHVDSLIRIFPTTSDAVSALCDTSADS